jgi:methyltransferase (TIGR00027 family)
MASVGIPGAVGQTAIGAASMRARESERADRLFDDQYAGAFVDAAPEVAARQRAAPSEPASPGEPAALGAIFEAHVAIRTRFLDDYLLAATAAGCRQVVLLAAGMDTRAYRLGWPAGTRLFEIDQPDVLAFKNAVLNSRGAVPRCDRAALAADLREDWTGTLLGSGLRPTERTAWLAEGLLIYLTAEEADRLLTATTGLSAPGSRIAFEYADSRSDNTGASDGGPVGRGLVRTMPGMSRITALWKGGLGADTPDWLAGHGWQVQTHPIGPVAAAYNRQIPGRASGRFVTASRGPRIP